MVYSGTDVCGSICLARRRWYGTIAALGCSCGSANRGLLTSSLTHCPDIVPPYWCHVTQPAPANACMHARWRSIAEIDVFSQRSRCGMQTRGFIAHWLYCIIVLFITRPVYNEQPRVGRGSNFLHPTQPNPTHDTDTRTQPNPPITYIRGMPTPVL